MIKHQPVSPDQSVKLNEQYREVLLSLTKKKEVSRIVYGYRRAAFHGISTKPALTQSQFENGYVSEDYGFAEITVNKISAYTTSNGFRASAWPDDASNELKTRVAEGARQIIDGNFNENTDFISAITNLVQQSGRDGDGYLIQIKDQNEPKNTEVIHLPEPEKVGVIYQRRQSTKTSYAIFSLTVERSEFKALNDVSLPKPKETYAQSINQKNGSGGFTLQNGVSIVDPRINSLDQEGMGEVEYFVDYRNDVTYAMSGGQFIGKIPYAIPVYHFPANIIGNSQYGCSDFELAVPGIAAFNKLFCEAINISAKKAHKKIATGSKQSAEYLQQNAGNINEDGILTVPNPGNIPLKDMIQILDTGDVGTFDHASMLRQTLDMIRMVTGLQELGQDMIAPNQSGKQLQQMWIGVTQVVKKKQERLQEIILRIIEDYFTVFAAEESKKAQLVADGVIQFVPRIKWGGILPQDDQALIGNIQALRTGPTPLISTETAMQNIEHLVSDPSEELRKIKGETEMTREYNMATNSSSQSLVAPVESGEVPGIASGKNNEGTANMMPASQQQQAQPEENLAI